MSDERELSRHDFRDYEQMSAEELAAVLRADAEADSNSELDSETLLYVMKLYARRQKDKPVKTAQEAFASFRRDYLPRVNEPSVWTEEVLIAKPPAKIKRWLPLTAAAAVLVLVLGVGTVGNSHLSKGGKPTYWQTRDYLVVSGNYNAEAVQNISEYAQQWYPQWLPEGYELTYTREDDESCGALYHYGAVAQEDSLNVTFRTLKASGAIRFSKNPEAAETFVHDGVRFYLYTNMERNCAVGCLDGIVISVNAKIPQEEIIRIVESMQLH